MFTALCLLKPLTMNKKGPKPLFPGGKLPVNLSKVNYNSTYFDIPAFYEDKSFKCKDCGTTEVWKAKQQKWWHEEAGGDLETTAVLCRKCRDFKKHQKDLQMQHNEKSKT